MTQKSRQRRPSSADSFAVIQKGNEKASKIDIIERQIRRLIQEGTLPPGSKLPPREKLQQMLQVSPNTLQKGIDRLIDSGFLSSEGPVGTFVAKAPPHLHHYGIVFCYQADEDRKWPEYHRLIRSAALMMARPDRRFSFYYLDHARPTTPSYQQLLRDVEADRLAGLFFASHPLDLVVSPLFENKDFPKVCMMAGVIPSVQSSIYFDTEKFVSMAVKRLKSLGRRRPALLTVGGVNIAGIVDAFRKECQAAKITCDDSLVQTIPMENLSSSVNVINLLMSLPPERRPDSFLISDDHLNDAAIVAFAGFGSRLGKDLDVVLQMNRPLAHQYPLAVHRLGWDIPSVLETAISHIVAIRQGKKVPAQIYLDPDFA